jgi:hypothetical protein
LASCSEDEVEVNDVVSTNATLEEITNNTEELEVRNTGITSIGGGTSSGFFSNGQWLGNTPACGRGSFYGYYVICTTIPTHALNYFTINGNNFGTTKGTVTSSDAAISLEVLSWSNTQIKVRPIAPTRLDYKVGITLTVNKSDKTKINSHKINLLGMIEIGRGFGQCTWEAAFQRLQMGLSIPTTAYRSTAAIDYTYVPRKGDILHWGTSHTGIIIDAPTRALGSDGTITYSFSLRERNESCNETTASQTKKSFAIRNRVITTGIASNNSRLKAATTYFR